MNQILCVFTATAVAVATLHNLCHRAFYSWVTWMQFDHAWIWTWYDYYYNAVFFDNQCINGVHLMLRPSHSSAPWNWSKKVFATELNQCHGNLSNDFNTSNNNDNSDGFNGMKGGVLALSLKLHLSLHLAVHVHIVTGSINFFDFRYSLCA